MPEASLYTALLIFFARVCDVGLGTIRHAMIIRGRRGYAFLIAFFESLIWIYAVSRVMRDVQDPFTSIAFALGFASGTFAGMTLEGFLKIGDQVIRIFTRNGEALAGKLRELGYRVTVFDGGGRDGPVQLLFVQSRRRKVSAVLKAARQQDPECFMILDDIRSVHIANQPPRTGGDLLPVAPLVTSDKK